ncbi:type I polyketide synthase [Polyangium jinanense]|uniref:SDR family NAD(P)-dependent oxidoreductase n=1 Tax=Polyangium jinanense TaxID=2829994 RepID=A0A9X3X1J8_9BACT|nr:type I polyketide synthase [Polyangium jinanense]MDC3954532.1 SDR family NAD(P)-dependent oxidoreductase [Polyangium jinanense]MDC3980835.1 SDR family NAD(P)-dependent oxidoreductase [Polyangium jinanense]
MTPPNAENLSAWLVSRLAELRGIDPRTIDPRERFHRYGLDSLGATKLLADLGKHLGRSLSPTLVWEYATPASLAKFLASNAGSSTSSGSSLRPPPVPSPAHRASAGNEPIAIVGMACRFPKAPDLDAFWRLLRDGIDAITEVPRDRWDASALYDPDNAAVGKVNTRWGGFLDHVEAFDPQFFGISPREAVQMDPQQRLTLELAVEALEDAGIPPSALKGSRTGVFVGALFLDHALLQDRAGRESISAHTSTGGASCIIANRLSYAFGLEGPSMTVDTACSSSLVAMHLASQSLRSGESNVAIAGGVSLMLVPETTMGFTKLNAMSPDGRCRAFDARGNGYVRSEGAGLVILKRLSDALRDGDRIYAVMRGSAVNNDGASNGLTAPNPLAQQSMLRDACRSAGVSPADIQYVEAHGTGTPLGDPIEAGALGAVIGLEHSPDQPLCIGSVKTNIGHLEAAAGMAGLLKVALAMQHDALPPTLHYESPNPNINFEALNLRVVTKVEPWPAPEGALRRAGVSSFGYGGTNAHVILESMARSTASVALLEAGAPEAMGASIGLALESIRGEEVIAGRVLRGPSAGVGQRLAVVASTKSGLEARLAEARSGAEGRGIFRGVARGSRRVVWVFSGQGSQWVGMGRSLVLSEPSFRAALTRCDRVLAPLLGWSVLDEIMAGSPRVAADRIDVMWPVLFAFQVALAELLHDLGLEPGAVIGHSIGEVAAAHVAGVLSLEDAARVIAHQATLVQRSAGQGMMLLAGVGWDEAQSIAASSGGRIHRAIAASPTSTVFSGDGGALAGIAASFASRGVFARPVNTGAAVHGPQMAYLVDELPSLLGDLHPMSARVPVVSALTGERIRGEDLDVAYWSRQLSEPVRFANGIQRLLDDGLAVFLEIAPHPIVKHSIEECIRHVDKQATAAAVAALWRNEDEGRSIREAVGQLFVHGASVIDRRTESDATETGHVHLLPVSGQTETAMRDAARRLVRFIDTSSETALRDVCFTMSVRRAHHRTCGVVAARSRAEVLDGLRAIADGRDHPLSRVGAVPIGGRRGLVFVFPGQGSQWVGMGRALFVQKPVFRESIEDCDAVIRREAGFSVIEELLADETRSQLGRIDVVQPMLFAIEVALAALWRAWGVEPDAVIGHSMGEIAAAHVAGVLSLDDAAKVICRRSKLLRRVAGLGGMALVELAMSEAERALVGYEDRLSVAVSNGPRSTVIAGEPAALDEVVAMLEGRGVFCRRVKVDVASHSPQMDVLKQDLSTVLADLRPRATKVAMRSTVTGELVSGAELDASYWVKNLRAPVLFGRAVAKAVEEGQTLFVEISPHPILLHSIEETLRALSKEGAAIASLRRNEDERHCLVDALGALHVKGHELAWGRLFPRGGRCISLPTYPWQRDRYWLPDEVKSRMPQSRPWLSQASHHEPDVHPLLGPPVHLSVEPTLHFWEQSLNMTALPYLAHHRVQNDPIFPGAGYVEMALSAVAEVHGKVSVALEEVTFDRMLPVGKDPERRVQFVLVDEEAGRASFQVSSREAGAKSWTRHAAGKVRTGVGAPGARISRERPRVLQARCPTVVDAEAFYRRMEEGGLFYGRSFRGLEQMWLGNEEGLARVFLPADVAVNADQYQVHPALLDACFQTLVQVHVASETEPLGTYVLSGIDRIRLHRSLGQEVWVHAQLHASDDKTNPAGDVYVIDADGRVQAEVQGLRIKRLESGKSASANALDDAIYAIEWRKKDLDGESMRLKHAGNPGAWLLFVDEGGTAASMAFLLLARGEACVRVRAGSRFSRLEAGLFEIDPTNPEHYQRVLREAFGREVHCRGIVHLYALDATPWERITNDTIERDIAHGCLSALYLVQAVIRQGWRDMPRLWLVTRGAQAVLATGTPLSIAQSTLWGLGRTIALEHPELECTRIDVDPSRSVDEASALLREISVRDREDQVAYRKEGRFVARLVHSSFDAAEAAGGNAPPEPANGRAFQLESQELGVLDRLVLREIPRRPPGPGEVEIQVEAAGLNFIDVMKAMGVYPGMTPGPLQLGLECAGRVVAVGAGVEQVRVGQEVVAFAAGSFGSHVTTHVEFVAPKPSKLSFAEAASVPVVFMTVYYALNKLARLGHDERVLVHTATGGTGLAAIQLARFLGAQIFATAGSEDKRAYLRSLGVEHVMDSRTLDFAGQVLEQTGGQGVDVVLNTLTGDGRTRSLEILAPYGRFVELSKRDIYDNGQLAMTPFRKSLSYAAVDLAGMSVERPALLGALLQEVMQLFDMGVFQPLPVKEFPVEEVRDAYRLMAQAKHVGKIVVKMNDPTVRILPVEEPKPTILANATYLVTGGLGGLGLSLSRWMVDRGARHLALVSRGAPSAAAREAISAMEKAGAEVAVLAADVTREDQVDAMLAEIKKRMPPLRGIVHAAGLLDDRTLLEMDEERFTRVMAPKVRGAFNLHTRTLDQKLDFFVLYSSSASLLGAPGQGNYAAANAFLDALSHARRRTGRPATSIHWGPFADIGLAAAQDNRGNRLSHRGIESLSPAHGLLAFGKLLERPRAEIGVLRLSVRQWVEYYPQVGDIPFWSELQRDQKATDRPPSSRISFRSLLERRPPQERLPMLEKHILEHVGQVLRLDIGRIDRLASFTSLGMDSLLSLELRNRLELSLGVRLSATLLFTYPNPASLADHLLDRMSLAQGKRSTDTSPPSMAAPRAERSSALPARPSEPIRVQSPRHITQSEAEILLELEEELARSEDYLS